MHVVMYLHMPEQSPLQCPPLAPPHIPKEAVVHPRCAPFGNNVSLPCLSIMTSYALQRRRKPGRPRKAVIIESDNEDDMVYYTITVDLSTLHEELLQLAQFLTKCKNTNREIITHTLC